MKTIYTPLHENQDAPYEYIRGRQVASFEMPRRAQLVLDCVTSSALGPVIAPIAHDMAPILRVHSPDFVTFLSTFWEEWHAENGDICALPNTWVPPRARRLATKRPGAELGRYCIDMSSPILSGTWTAARAAVDAALTGADMILEGGERAIFALCRPPGHHAGRDYFGGYCFLNNAAIAAQSLRDSGKAKVAVLDVDYHHGNGTQDIFYDRDDVLTVSIHADPSVEYPYYSGYPDETGEGEGAGFCLNLPLPFGATYAQYSGALSTAVARIADFGADALVVSLGVDTFANDPISHFKLFADDYSAMGAAIAVLGLPTLFVMEGGYAVEDIGVNVVNVLTGFEAAVV
jgi:acetoin utilization deacetylase AcuC-like enzyme